MTPCPVPLVRLQFERMGGKLSHLPQNCHFCHTNCHWINPSFSGFSASSDKYDSFFRFLSVEIMYIQFLTVFIFPSVELKKVVISVICPCKPQFFGLCPVTAFKINCHGTVISVTVSGDLEEQVCRDSPSVNPYSFVYAAVEPPASPVQRRVICLCDFSGMSRKAFTGALRWSVGVLS